MPASGLHPLSLHDALPILFRSSARAVAQARQELERALSQAGAAELVRSDRKSTRLNSSHLGISYAVFCLKKKTKQATRAVDSRSRMASCVRGRNAGNALPG